MTAKEYFRQAYRLDQKINSDIQEAAQLREMALSVSSPRLGDRVQTSRASEAPFTKSIEKIIAMEEFINNEIDLFVDLKTEMHTVIDSVSNEDERMILRWRYIHGYTWEQIGSELNMSTKTVRRRHGMALSHVVLPENPIRI